MGSNCVEPELKQVVQVRTGAKETSRGDPRECRSVVTTSRRAITLTDHNPKVGIIRKLLKSPARDGKRRANGGFDGL